MNIAVCLLVGIDAPDRALAQGAARSVFPQATLLTFNTLAEALESEAAEGGELLVMANPDPAITAQAVAATDATGLRRWAVVFFGAAPAVKGVESISRPEADELLLAHAMRSAVAQHQLVRENARLHGDLRTVAYRITHDLRTPLSGISSAGEALKEIVIEHEPASDGLTKSLFDSVEDLGRLIDRVSQVTRASLNPVSKIAVPMGEVVWAVLQRQERQILRKRAEVLQPGNWPEVKGVAAWLEAVWGNLLRNALQHANEPARIELGWNQANEGFRFWVADNGNGISSENLPALFQPFHLLHHTNARKGLGLSIVQRLVELQGGDCSYEPGSGGGSRFCFTLPA